MRLDHLTFESGRTWCRIDRGQGWELVPFDLLPDDEQDAVAAAVAETDRQLARLALSIHGGRPPDGW